MKLDINRVVVKFNDRKVGYLEQMPGQRIAFQYDLEWLEKGFSISPFHLPLTSEVFTSKSSYFEGLFGVFYDSLPDAWGTLLFRKMLQKKGIDYDQISPLSKLSLLSGNGLGGLSYEPTQGATKNHPPLDFDQLADSIQPLFEEFKEDLDFDLIYQLGGSSGGTRPKAHVNISGEAWIVKFPAFMDPKDSGFLEYQANQLAVKCGIQIPEFQLFPSKKHQGYFGSKRFDRNQTQRMHVISLSSILETSHEIPNLDYAHMFQVIQKISVDQSDMYEAYQRMVFNVFYQNKDDHGKNVSFIYDTAMNGYRLSPFFDVTKTPHKLEHEMTVLGHGNPKETELIEIAKTFKLSLKKVQHIIDITKAVMGL